MATVSTPGEVLHADARLVSKVMVQPVSELNQTRLHDRDHDQPVLGHTRGQKAEGQSPESLKLVQGGLVHDIHTQDLLDPN